MMEPNVAILDETDSGLDIDALKTVAQGINSYRNSKRSIILITHYQRILDYLDPDKIHILIDGTIVKQGGLELVDTLEEKGYKWIQKESLMFSIADINKQAQEKFNKVGYPSSKNEFGDIQV